MEKAEVFDTVVKDGFYYTPTLKEVVGVNKKTTSNTK